MPEPTLPTQQFVAVKEIRDGVVHLKGGGLRRVLMVSGVNFDLKSENEQELILNVFQNFLNSLDFPVQFFIHSRKVNIENYLERLRERQELEENELLKIQIAEYIEFVKSFVHENAIISKAFFAVVPYEAPGAEKATRGLFTVFKATTPTKEENTEEQLKQLNQRVTQVINGLSANGLRAVPLEDGELVELFYNLYNPQLVERRGVAIAKDTKRGAGAAHHAHHPPKP